ncbi:hypothetical protein M5E87_06690 [Flavonifractor plautii]|nr:hypothetical protein M5E87_06690 [Flavonifractor plautii]
MESVIIALWVFSDLALLNLLAGSCSVLAQSVFSLKERKHAVLPLLLLAWRGLVPLSRRLFPGAVDGGPGQDGQPALRLRHSCFAPAGKKLRRQV